jgi:L-malate glycosyltransferase
MGFDKKIKVCHLISGDLWAGAEVQMLTVATLMKSMPEFDVSAIVLNEGKLAEKLKKDGFSAIVIDESKNSFFQILRKATEIIRINQPDILHTHRYKENVLGALLKKRCKIRHLVQTVHGSAEPFSGAKKLRGGFYDKINNYCTRRYFSKILAVSYKIAEEMRQITKKDNVITIHNSINADFISPTNSPSDVRKMLGLSQNCVLVGSAGRLAPIKGYDIFLEMAAIIIKKAPEVKFLLIGDGPSRKSLEEKACNLGLGDAVIFPGFRDDIADLMKALDIFVISSYNEGIPMVVLEAMTLGIPVVSTKVGGIKEILVHNVTGMLSESGNPQGLADACLTLLENPELSKKLSNAARKRIDEEFSPGVQRGRILKFYNEVANSK